MDPTLLDDDEDLKEFERVQKEDQPEDTCLDNEGPATFIFRRPPDELDEDDVEGQKENDNDSDTEPSRPTDSRKRKARSERATLESLPPVPQFFDYMRRQKHKAYHTLPRTILGCDLSPSKIFAFFFTNDVFEGLATNTNAYAKTQGAGKEGSREWVDTSVNEMRIYLGILIHMGIFQQPTTHDYWKTSDEYPQHRFTQYMTLTRFHQIKRFFHVSPPSEPSKNDSWFSKVEPLSSKLETAFRRYYVPSTDVSVDEMMVRFKGQSKHTAHMTNRPISAGYKIISIRDSGYTYSFQYTSRVNAALGIQKVPGLNDTACAVYHLVKTLPYRTREYNVFMDNHFSNIPLFLKLRDLKIGACGTARINSALFPKTLKIRKGDRYDWNTLSGVVVQGKVLAAFWMENAPVTMLSTIHALSPDNGEWFVAKERRRPRETRTNSASVRAAFQGNPRATIRIPRIIDDYNLNMDGVDLSDQYRSFYDTQFTSRRAWVPLFFWLLDTTIVNAFLISKLADSPLTHRDFRLKLAWGLMEAARVDRQKIRKANAPPPPPEKIQKSLYISKNIKTLPRERLVPGIHVPKAVSSRPSCILCRYKKNRLGEGNRERVGTSWICELCDVPLCIKSTSNCFAEYHTRSEF